MPVSIIRGALWDMPLGQVLKLFWDRPRMLYMPIIVIGYPSAIKILAGLVEDGRLETHFTGIITCGGPLSRGLREYTENVFYQ